MGYLKDFQRCSSCPTQTVEHPAPDSRPGKMHLCFFIIFIIVSYLQRCVEMLSAAGMVGSSLWLELRAQRWELGSNRPEREAGPEGPGSPCGSSLSLTEVSYEICLLCSVCFILWSRRALIGEGLPWPWVDMPAKQISGVVQGEGEETPVLPCCPCLGDGGQVSFPPL